MIFEVQNYYFIFQDAVFSRGIGFLRGGINRLITAFLPQGKIPLFIKDVVMGLVFTVLIFSYSVSFANYRVLRFYSVIFALLGMAVFPKMVTVWRSAVSEMLGITLRFITGKAKRFAQKTVQNQVRALQNKKAVLKNQKNAQKNIKNVLPNMDNVLYN